MMTASSSHSEVARKVLVKDTILSLVTSHHVTRKLFRLMGDEQQHNPSACPNFKAWSVEESLSEVQKHKPCFCCLRPRHWLTTCRNLKRCGVNGCTRRHNTLLHSSRNVTPDGNNELKQQHQLTKQHQKQLHYPPSILVHLIKVVVTLFYYKLCLLLCMGQRDTSTHMQC